MTELTRRLLTALVAAPLIICFIALGDPEGQFWFTDIHHFGLPFLGLILVAIFLGLWEFYKIMETRGLRPMRNTGIIGGLMVGFLAYFSNGYFLTIVLTATILLVMMIQLSKKDVSTAITGISVTIFGVIYIAWLLSHAILLRGIGPELENEYHYTRQMLEQIQGSRDVGLFFVLLVIACTFLNDTGAYFTGKAWGRRKLAPRISPKKTWEGAAGGVVASAVTAIVIKLILVFPFKIIHCLILGFLIGVSAVFGDLVESLVKRDARLEDTGGLLPGHGGIMDRLDSLLFTIPLTYYYAKIYYYMQTVK